MPDQDPDGHPEHWVFQLDIRWWPPTDDGVGRGCRDKDDSDDSGANGGGSDEDEDDDDDDDDDNDNASGAHVHWTTGIIKQAEQNVLNAAQNATTEHCEVHSVSPDTPLQHGVDLQCGCKHCKHARVVALVKGIDAHLLLL